MPLHLSQLQPLWGEPLGAGIAASDPPLAAIGTDSRRPVAGGLFLPLVGERFDGHAFLADAIAAGSRAVVLQAERLAPGRLEALLDQAGRCGCSVWVVADTLLAYQQLATLWRRQLEAAVVAVTGSAGKTTTRELIRVALASLGPVLASRGNENNDVGVPLTLLQAGREHRAVVVEMGMRGLGEIERLSSCAGPDVAVITNIGTAHIGRLGSREAIAQAKCEITRSLAPDGVVVIPAGDPLLDGALAGGWAGRVVRIALADEPAAHQADWLGALDETNHTLVVDGEELELPLEGRHHARNLMLALAVARELGVELTALRQLQVELPGGRSRRLDCGGVRLLDETYNASPEAVLASLDLLARQNGGRRFAVLGTMLELGEQSLELHRGVAQRAGELALDGLVIVDAGAEGAAMEQAAAGMARLARVATPEQAAAVLRGWLAPGDTVLLKASRGVALERLIPLLPTSAVGAL
ncbi:MULTISPECIES: UDP-N-acetylmuramoyl-tripeptide--D-alanyl-D-alanine ligase [Aphanothece]|uniref:UDP-N-acetylmuramoyl-tripeptide--D-alanyl-D- alanine ligase n=1 Tax=Aphanothece TaxID=1121 RepID=UPI00398462C7